MPFLTVPGWTQFDGLVHGFFGRKGGISRPPFDSLNVSFDVGDAPESVKQNLCEAKKALGIHSAIVTAMTQVHGCEVRLVDEATGKQAGEGDALLTDRSNCFLAIKTADCVPILIVEPRRRLAGAVHAGWRGTVKGIVAKAVKQMEEEFGTRPEAFHAALGPCIGHCCYEVGPEVEDAVSAQWRQIRDKILLNRGGRFFLDLRLLNQLQLQEMGLPSSQIHVVGPCTADHTGLYFSHRAEGGRTGRQMSLIGWKARSDDSTELG